MSDDETIRIRVDAAQASAAVDAFQKEVRELEAELKTLNSTAGVTNAEINGTTRRLEEAKGKLATARETMQGFGQSAQAAGFNMQDFTKSIGAGISIVNILRDNLAALEPVMQRNKDLLIEQATAAGADRETLEGLSLMMDSLIHPTHFFANAIKATAEGMKQLAEESVGASTVVANVSESIPQMLAKIGAARKAAAEENKTDKKSEEDAAKSLAAEEEALEKAAIRSAEERAKAEAAAAESIKKSLEAQRVAREAMLAQLDAEILAAEERLKKQTTGGTVVEEFLPEGAPEEVKALKDEMRSLENQPFLDSGQQQRVEELKNKIADAGSQILKTYGVWKATNEMADGTHEAFNAAWDAYIARLNKSEVQHQNVMDDLQRLEGGYDDLGGTVDDVGGSFEDIAEAAGDLGKEAKKGTDAAKEGLDGLKAGAEEAIPLLEQIKGLLAEIKQAASEVEL